jgi:hypothetical protein
VLEMRRSAVVLGILSVLFALAVTATKANAADAAQLNENMKRFLAAGEVAEAYVPSLRLVGNSLRDAFDVLLVEGFRCGIKWPRRGVLPPPYDDVPPYLQCSKEHAGLGEYCDAVILSVLPPDSWQPKTESEFLAGWRETKVEGSMVICPPPIAYEQRIVDRYAQNRASAERSVMQRLNALPIARRSAEAAVNLMLAQKLNCGVESSKKTKSPSNALQVTCVNQASETRYCYEERATLVLNLPKATMSAAELLKQMDSVVVKSVTAACALPPLVADVAL